MPYQLDPSTLDLPKGGQENGPISKWQLEKQDVKIHHTATQPAAGVKSRAREVRNSKGVRAVCMCAKGVRVKYSACERYTQMFKVI